MSATVTVRWMEGDALKEGGLETLDAARADGRCVWVDVLEPDQATLETIGTAFALHALALEDCLHFPQRVKIDLYPEAAFVVWQFPRHGNGTLLSTVEMDIFLGQGFLVTSHREPITVIDEVGAEAAMVLKHGADWTLHRLLDRGTDEIFPVVDHLSDQLDELEDVLLDDPVEEDLQRLYAIKRALVAVYRVVTGERDVLRGMARRQQYVSEEAYLYFQDVGDHLARAVETIDTYRDVASSAMDLYLSAVNNRLNDVMRRLTVVATIFMPLTLLSGIYGMNITKGMWPPVEAVWSFPLVIGSMLVTVATMLWVFKRRRWW